MVEQTEIYGLIQSNGLNTKTREIFIFPEDDGDIDYRTAQQFIKNLRILESINRSPILVISITGGGDVNYSLGVYDAIKYSPCYISILVYGLASSMSSVILQGADLRILSPNSHVFIHDIDVGIDGSIHTVRSDIQQWEADNNKIYDIYTERCQNGRYFIERKYNKSKIKAYLKRKGESGLYLNPTEAIDLGLADFVLGEEPYKSVQDLLQ